MEEPSMSMAGQPISPGFDQPAVATIATSATKRITRTCGSYVVIPARLASTRLPRKLLLAQTGKPLIQHTYEAAKRARRPIGVCVAADSEEIATAVRSFGGQVFLTSPTCASGTDRIAEVAPHLSDAEIVINVQGDEPELSGNAVDMVAELLEQHPAVPMATLATPIRDREKLCDPACVKVVMASRDGIAATSLRPPTAFRAVYFSRAAVPHARDWHEDLLLAD